MKFFLITFIFGLHIHGISQDDVRNSGWGVVDRYRLTTYAFSLFDNASGQIKAGSELQVELVSYKQKRHEIALATGAFFINIKARLPENPSMQYFYIPITLNYRLYSKSRNVYGEFSLGRPLVMYEDSKYFAYNKFWLGYESALFDPSIVRKRIWGIHAVKFGYNIGNHVSVTVGEMSYMFSSEAKKFRHLTRLSLGVDFKL